MNSVLIEYFLTVPSSYGVLHPYLLPNFMYKSLCNCLNLNLFEFSLVFILLTNNHRFNEMRYFMIQLGFNTLFKWNYNFNELPSSSFFSLLLCSNLLWFCSLGSISFVYICFFFLFLLLLSLPCPQYFFVICLCNSTLTKNTIQDICIKLLGIFLKLHRIDIRLFYVIYS